MIEKFDKSKHLGKMASWMKDWRVEFDEKNLSDIGFVIDDKMIGFLVTTNTGAAWIDNFVCDPNTDKEEREKLNRRMISVLEVEAIKRGCWSVLVLAGHKRMVDRLNDMGFHRHKEFTLFHRGSTCLG